MAKVTKDITGTDQFTDSISTITFDYNGQGGIGFLNIHIFKNPDDPWTGVVELKKYYEDEPERGWNTIDTFDTDINTYLMDYESGVLYKLGISSDGSYSGGTIPVRLSR